MSRTIKNIVEYFPHSCNHSKTMFVLVSQYGNNGYAFWFRLLEILGKTENHFLDLNKKTDILFLVAETHITGTDVCQELLDLLSDLEAIDSVLWTQCRVVWVQKFVDNLAGVYKKRGREIPSKPVIDNNKVIPDTRKGITVPEMLQSKVKESKVKESKVKKSKDTCVCPHQKIIELYHKICPMLPKVVEWSATRQSYLKTRWNENIERQNLDWWEQYFIKVSNSDFLTGKKNDFMANLEWLVRPTNFIKVLEGNFNSREKGAVKTQAQKNIENANEWLQEKLAQQEQEKKDA